MGQCESQRVETLVEDLVEDGHLLVIFDVAHVDYVDSAGIGMLALVSGKLRESGGRLAIVAPEGRVLQMLKMTQIINILNVYNTQVPEAVVTFGSIQPKRRHNRRCMI